MIEPELREHLEQGALLQMLRDHLIPNEIHRLIEIDLRFADLLAELPMKYVVPPRRGSTAGGPEASAFLEP